MGRNSAHPLIDAAIAELAGRQHGVVALEQLIEIGLTASGVRSRVERGRLHPVHRGVYSVGHPLLTAKGRMMAAVLACGPGAVLSHRAAADLHGLRPSSAMRIDVTIGGRERRRRGIAGHRSRTLMERDRTAVDGIPCPSLARTP